MIMHLNRLKALCGILLALALGSSALAQDFPSKPITIVVPFIAGTPADLFGRALSDQLATVLKQPVLVDNRPGAYQVIAGSLVARAKPDGYTLMLVTMPNVIPPALQASLPYTRHTDSEAVSYIGSLNMVLAVSPSLPVSNLGEFITLVKSNPGKYMYGAGVGTPPHMNSEMFNKLAGTKTQHIPYASFQAIMLDVSSGQLQFSLVPANAMQLAATGKLKVLGTTAAKRDPAYPDVPTLDEQGIKGLNDVIKVFVLAPKGTPWAVVSRLNAAINTVTSTEAYFKRLAAIGGVTVPESLPVTEVARRLAIEDERFQALVREGSIKLE